MKPRHLDLPCFGHSGRRKKRYETEKAAKKAAADGQRSLRPYRCPDCQGWHLTRTNRKD